MTIRSPLIGLSMTWPPAMGEPYPTDPDNADIVLSQLCRKYFVAAGGYATCDKGGASL